MEQKIGQSQLKIKYQEAALQAKPSGISAYLGTLRKGAVVQVLEETHPYYYKVRLDNGLEGFVYKPSGEITRNMGSLALSKITTSIENSKSNGNGVGLSQTVPLATPESYSNGNGSNGNGNGRSAGLSRPAVRRPQPVQTRSNTSVRPARPTNSSDELGYMISSGGRSTSKTGSQVIIVSGEIAVFDKPGIVGNQVGKLRRGEQAPLVGQDSYFYQVRLASGQTGYIPRYSAETLD